MGYTWIMSDKRVFDQLNHLVVVNNDAEAGFLTAAKNVRNSEIQTLFEGYSSRHAALSAEIQDQVERLGESPSDSGSLGGSLTRGWMDLKATLTGHSVGSMLSACENGEQTAESAYLDALDVITSGKVHTLLQKHCEEIKGFRTRLARLTQEMKDGVEFQKNA